MSKSGAKASAKGADPSKDELVHEVLGHLADKWTLYVIDALGEAEGFELRFSQLLEAVAGVSQKMLTKTLRQLERDGLVTRHVHAVVPPRVDYRLTGLGQSLGEAVCAFWVWVDGHADDVRRARRAFDRKRAGGGQDGR